MERRDTRDGARQAYLLVGVIFDADGQPMTPSHAVKKGVRYRYYVSHRLISSVRPGAQRDQAAGQRLPAVQVEPLILGRLKAFFADPDAIVAALPVRRRDTPSRKRALTAARDIVIAIDARDETHVFDRIRPLIARVQVHLDRIEIDLRADRVVQALLPEGDSIRDRADAGPQDASPESDAIEFDPLIRLTIVAALKRAGMEMKFIIEGAREGTTPDDGLVRLITRAHALARRLSTSPGSNLEDAGVQEGMGAPYAARLMRLNYLAPDIVVAILAGRQPAQLTANTLMADTRLPLEWSGQRAQLGFA